MLIAAAWLVFAVFACQRYEPDETVQTRQETPGNRNLPPPWGFAIYVLAGQSNMTGGDADIPQNLPENNGHIWAYTNAGTWALAQEPLDDPTGQVHVISRDLHVGIGPGLSFVAALYAAHPHRDIALVPCAKGGSSIRHWQRNLSIDSLYGSCLARIRQAQQCGTVEGVIFYQGEADARKTSHAQKWPERFLHMVGDLRADLGDDELPVLFAQLATVKPPLAYSHPAWDYLKVLQARIDAYNVAMVKTEDLPLSSPVHLSAASEVELGRRFARVLVERFPDRIASRQSMRGVAPVKSKRHASQRTACQQ